MHLKKRIRHQFARGTKLAGAAAERAFKGPLSKLVNTKPYHAIYSRIVKRKAQKMAFPTSIGIEPINVCNAKCIMCPYVVMNRAKSKMTFELYKKIIDDIVENKLPVKNISLVGLGEPLLDVGIVDKVKYAKNAGLNVDITTNASMLTEKKGEELIDAGLDWLNFSFNGGTKEDYEKIMGINYERTCENILNFIKLKEKKKSEKPYLSMSCVLLKENIEHKDKIQEMWGKHMPVAFNFATDWAGSVKVNFVNNTYKEKKWPCHQLWEKFIIAWDGKVTGCCPDMDEYTFNLGNVENQTLTEIWNGPKWNTLREMHLRGDYDKINICKGCNVLTESSIRWWKQ